MEDTADKMSAPTEVEFVVLRSIVTFLIRKSSTRAVPFSREHVCSQKCCTIARQCEHPHWLFEYNVGAEVLGGGLKDSDCQTSDCQHSSSCFCRRGICHVEIGSASGEIYTTSRWARTTTESK